MPACQASPLPRMRDCWPRCRSHRSPCWGKWLIVCGGNQVVDASRWMDGRWYLIGMRDWGNTVYTRPYSPILCYSYN
ncbi:hypothetical protein HBI56_007960 [Parastagonospora nodorum]|uniref:Uncharacterized protein n=1 Tax=Phaeosphaeria nodorum (strain SN15 / ATCC MYA-4574 / FGSC 10173) TaxID=321614 RepID=A0A7U2HTA9_PHANO|nr:hypothetical protein HBH56_121760 [Parastagonospora nodorum]QRC91005.1 hypothetical protein JI435_400850 [Parastagonospora nodorum SN15]KAH3934769.1 hypothetical protein HBH54_047310 [Parastagonospora nodorum]KAH3986706.1 hypothetical protein HBH51_009740 [Parastagonospora nodorum]KAH3987297.1 hypothetical protein HBH52_037680 [Parastagonospora nodorum]